MTSADPQSAVHPGRGTVPTLALVVPYALGLVGASLVGRAFVPAAVGTVRWSDRLLWIDAHVAQIAGALSTALLAVLLVRASMSTRAAALRIVVSVLGGFALLLAMTSSGGVRTPEPMLFAGGAAASLVCLVVAASGPRLLPELGLALAALSVVVRLVAVALTLRGSIVASWVATLGFALEIGIVASACAFLLKARLRGATVIGVAVVAAALAAWLLAAEPEAERWVILRHAIDGLAPRPRPLGPWSLAPVLAVFSAVVGVGVCIARRADRGVVGAVALVVAVRAHAEVPLLGLALTIAAVSLFLARASSVASPARPAAPRGTSPRPDSVQPGDRLAPGRPLD